MSDPRDEALRKIRDAWDRVGSYMSAKDFVWEVQAILALYEAVTAREVEEAREQVRRGGERTEG